MRLLEGDDPEIVSAASGFSVADLLRARARLDRLVQNEGRKKALEATREAIIEDRVRQHLTAQGYSVTTRRGLKGPDVIGSKDGQELLVEVKGDRPGRVDNPGTINVDVLTLLGQIVVALSQRLADDYAIAVRPRGEGPTCPERAFNQRAGG